MKKLYTITAVLFYFSAFAQEMNVHLTDGTIESYPLSQIDSITFNVPSDIPTEGLIAYYPFNGNANDESGNGNNGTINGATLTSDRFSSPNKAYDFVGNDENNIAISPFIPPEIISISIWFKPITNGPGGNLRSVIFSNQQMFVNHDAINIIMEDGKIHFALLNSSGGEYGILSNNTITLNQWHHLVCIIDSGKNMKIFLDNIAQNQTISWTGMYNGLNVTNIGNVYLDNDNFDGSLDDVRIYNRALSESEIQALYQEGGWTK
jgi:hypothetical protein